MTDQQAVASERFIFPRHPIKIALLIKEDDCWRPYFTTNLSVTGALVELYALPQLGTTLECLLSEHGLFPFAARVVRMATGGIGVEFVEATPDFSAAVGRIIAGHQELYG